MASGIPLPFGDDEALDYGEAMARWEDEDLCSYREVVEAREDVEVLGGYVVVELDRMTADNLVARARERGVDPGRLAGDILRGVLAEEEGEAGGGQGRERQC